MLKIYVDLRLDIIVEENKSKNAFSYIYVCDLIRNGYEYVKKNELDQSKKDFIKILINIIKVEIEENKIDNIKDLTKINIDNNFFDRIKFYSTTTSDKLYIKVDKFKKKLKMGVVLDNLVDAELIKYNIENEKVILNHLILTQIDEKEWVKRDILNNNEYFIGKKFLAYNLCVVKKILKDLNLVNIGDKIDEDKFNIIIPFLDENFNKLKNSFFLQTENFKNDFINILRFINSLINKYGYRIKMIKHNCKKIIIKEYFLLYIDDNYFKKSIELYDNLVDINLENIIEFE
jgi:hypothetical protein